MLNWGFVISILAICFLMLTTNVSIYTELGIENKTLLELIICKGRSWIFSSGGIYWEEVFLNQPQRGVCDYITIVTAIPFLLMFFRENSNGALRNRIFCEGKKRFCLTRVCCGLLCGGLLVLLGEILFLGIVWYFFPSAQNFLDAEQMLFLFGEYTATKAILLHICKMFLYGSMASLFSIVLSAFTRDIYICLMIPFFVCWLLVILQEYLTSLLDLDYPDAKGTVWEILRWIRNYGRLDCVVNIELWQCFVVVVLFSVLASFIFTIRMGKRRDQGA